MILGKMIVEVSKTDSGITGEAKFEGNYADLVAGVFFASVLNSDLAQMLKAIVETLDSEEGKKMAANIRKQLNERE